MLTLSSPISSTRMSLQPLAAPTTKLVDKVKNKAQAVERRNLVIEPQWTARSQNISINLIWKFEMKDDIKMSSSPPSLSSTSSQQGFSWQVSVTQTQQMEQAKMR